MGSHPVNLVNPVQKLCCQNKLSRVCNVEEGGQPEQAPEADAQSPPQSEGDTEAEDSGDNEIGKEP